MTYTINSENQTHVYIKPIQEEENTKADRRLIEPKAMSMIKSGLLDSQMLILQDLVFLVHIDVHGMQRKVVKLGFHGTGKTLDQQSLHL